MRQYETLLLLRPDLSDEQVQAAIQRNRDLVERMGGTVDRTDEWGVRELAYPIRKFTRGYYVLLEYTAGPEVVRELDRTLKIAGDVLRFMTVVRAEVRQRGAAKARRADQEAAPADMPQQSSAEAAGGAAARTQPPAEKSV